MSRQHQLREIEWRAGDPAKARREGKLVSVTDYFCDRCQQLFPSPEEAAQSACLTKAERQRLN